jgi:Carboxymuconolactone decarboxylase family
MIGSKPVLTYEDVRQVAPPLAAYTQNRLLGDVWKRPGLAPRDRSIVTLAALIARSQTIEMPCHFNLALDNGVKPREISEIITHLGGEREQLWRNIETKRLAGQTSRVPGRHVRRVRRSVGAGTKEPVVVVGVDVMSLHHPHQMHRIAAAGKAAVSVVYVVADRLGAGEPLRADPERAGAMFRLRHAVRHGPGFLAVG